MEGEIELHEMILVAAGKHKAEYIQSWKSLNLTPKEGIVEANASGFYVGYKTAHEEFVKEIERLKERVTAAQREIVGGYYARIFHMEPLDKETILQWFEDDLRYIAGEEAVQSVKQILNIKYE